MKHPIAFDGKDYIREAYVVFGEEWGTLGFDETTYGKALHLANKDDILTACGVALLED